ncbi:hypothetical protein H0S70_07100 [Chryseobacterium manosquense]|uniref:Uncharacterized protein n=1 Tax=Chryseobacterium manosquense TaxID=2754694 RepID=A0A7H1DT65_9FLAO|nr:hypothetical protein [Chryseobacterium manosquense]QNS40173.1 hypothetical protein H0S70_07100 [Chryseobacterium manosquense]
MIEKTFEELFYDRIGNFDTEHHELIEKWEFIKLLQQVREATKSEVLTLCDDNFFSKEPKGKLMENIENLPTDRIKIDEKE